MKMTGRTWRGGAGEELDLSSVTIICSLDEMNRFLQFVKGLKRAYELGRKKAEMCYSHFRDWDEEWTEDMPDIAFIKKE